MYYEPALASAARSKIACLAGMLDALAPAIPDARKSIHWSALVLTNDAAYVADKSGAEDRWVAVFGSDKWDQKTLAFLVSVIPHEQTHLSQRRAVGKLPRWFAEGHAEWAGLEVTALVRPDLAQQERDHLASEFGRLGTAHLATWGAMTVKPEAIERQLSAADRARKAKDPSFMPDGPFQFGPDDIVQDNANEQGRYGAALAIFDGLAQRYGSAEVGAWISDVLAAQEPQQITLLAKQRFGEDIQPLLQ